MAISSSRFHYCRARKGTLPARSVDQREVAARLGVVEDGDGGGGQLRGAADVTYGGSSQAWGDEGKEEGPKARWRGARAEEGRKGHG